MPALHPEAQTLLDMIRSTRRPGFEALSPAEARQVYGAGRLVLQRPPEPVAESRDILIETPAGSLALRLYRGAGTAADQTLPALLYLHGGGWVVGDLNSHDGLCRRFANLAHCCVIAVDYRLAPEHPYPAAVEDAAAALAWISAQSTALLIDPARIAVGGDSAGGTLAAVLALMGRDGTVPAPCFQMLLYPATDFGMNTGSYHRITQGMPLTATTMRWFIDHYTPNPARRTEWQASPLLAGSLAGTPPAFVLTVGHDPLADEGQAYARRLAADDVRVTSVHLTDQIHGMLTMNRVIPSGDVAVQYAALTLRDAWHRA
jgi:acetyl esterase